MQAQAQEIISSAGSSLENANGELDYTIGEVITTTHSQGNESLTQGFHQPNVMVSYIEENTVDVQLFPNPNHGIFFIAKKDLQPFGYRILSIQGQLLETGAFTSIKMQFDLSEYANGHYLMEIYSMEEKTQKTILKINKTN